MATRIGGGGAERDVRVGIAAMLAASAMPVGEIVLVRGIMSSLPMLACAAATNCGGCYGINIAMRAGHISAIGPFRYAAIVFAVVLGYLVFGEVADAPMLVGIAIVILAGLYTLRRERVRGVYGLQAPGRSRR